MSVFDSNMNYIETPDLEKGYLTRKTAKLTWNYILESEEEGHYITLAEYPNGGKDVDWVVDVPEVGHWETKYEDGTLVDMEHYDGDEQPDESWDHTIEYTTYWDYQLYTQYTEEELAQIEKDKEKQQLIVQLGDLEQKMSESNDTIMQIVEQQILGIEVMEADAQRYAEIIAQRMDWRSQIDEIKTKIRQDGDDSDV